MPIFDVKCDKCGNIYNELCITLEEVQKMLDKMNRGKAKCILCDGRLRKQLSAPHIRFKGKGFYTTDNK